jgi:hypothetical protein
MNQGTYSEQPDIDPASVQQIAKDYGLDCEALAYRLQQIAIGAFTLRESKKSEPDTEEVSRYIEAMRNPAAALRNKLINFPVNSTFHAELFSRTKTFYTLGAELTELITALDDLDPSGWKEKKVTTVFHNSLVYQLATLWKQQTGKPVTGSKKSGQFLAFMCECADVLGIDSQPLPDRFVRLRRKNKGTDFEI